MEAVAVCIYYCYMDCFPSVCIETMTVMCVHVTFILGMAFIKLQLNKRWQPFSLPTEIYKILNQVEHRCDKIDAPALPPDLKCVMSS